MSAGPPEVPVGGLPQATTRPTGPRPVGPKGPKAPKPWAGQNLVFVVGCPRSGTTWVQRLLAEHPRVRIGQESFIFSSYVAPQIKTWKWEWRREFNPATATGRGGVGLSAFMVEREFLRGLRRYTDGLLRPMLKDLRPGQLYVDKTPTHARCIPEIKQLYPAAKIVHVVRDPRDVVASWQKASKGWGKGWAPTSVKGPINQWLGHVAAVREAERWLHSWDFYEVNYERLSGDPETVLGELAAFLGLTWEKAAIAAAVDRNDAEKLRAGGGVKIPVGGAVAQRTGSGTWSEPSGFVGPAKPGNWKRALTPLQKVEIWRRARKAMRREKYAWSWLDFLPDQGFSSSGTASKSGRLLQFSGLRKTRPLRSVSNGG